MRVSSRFASDVLCTPEHFRVLSASRKTPRISISSITKTASHAFLISENLSPASRVKDSSTDESRFRHTSLKEPYHHNISLLARSACLELLGIRKNGPARRIVPPPFLSQ